MVKFRRERGSAFRWEGALITLLQDVEYSKNSTPGCTTKHNKLVQFPVCAYVGVLFSLEIRPQACENTYKLDFLISNFGFGVLPSQKCYVMFQYSAIQDRATDPISVAFIDEAGGWWGGGGGGGG